MTRDPAALVGLALAPPAPDLAGLDELVAAWTSAAIADRPEAPVERAVRVAARASELGVAFAAGYWAATESLLAGCGAPCSPGERTSLAVTERKGAHPRALETRLCADAGGLALDGEKSFATLADRSSHVLVVAVDAREVAPTPAAHPRLVAVRAPVAHAGLTLHEGVSVPFCPGVSHPVLRLATPASEDLTLVGGDAFTDVLQPFRTLEDRAVCAATLAFLLAWASRAGVAAGLRGRLVALLADALRRAGEPDGDLERVTALGVSGLVRATLSELVPAFEAAGSALEGGDGFVAALSRDAPLLDVAERLRVARAEKALTALSASR